MASSFRNWVKDSLNVPDISDAHDFSLIYRGDMVKIWDYLMETVVSKDKAYVILKNLSLAHRIAPSVSSKEFVLNLYVPCTLKAHNMIIYFPCL